MDSSAHFKKQLDIGKVGETEISKWLISRGANVLPVYEIAENQYKGPALYTMDGGVIAPDIICFKKGKVTFIEAKHKNAFSWYRKKSIWTTGIDKKHFEEYVRIQDITEVEVWILFLHRGGIAKDSPPSPSGLYGESIEVLKRNIDHESNKFGKGGMVFWNRDTLKQLATYPL